MSPAYAFGPGCHMKYSDCPAPPEYLWLYFAIAIAAAIGIGFLVWYWPARS